uniref:Uncharacterized protein n=1 Tax=Vitis vinifera TaxID=29760 RepID=A5BDT6_VITVI|nr:hypothetical protein VITISV_011559 [Vitis vinifera]
MRKIWPSQDNCIHLKDKFASCEFGTPTCEIKAYLAKWKWNTAAQSQRSPTCESDFATCELGAQRAKMDSKLRNQLARFSQVTMQRAKSTCELGYLCTDSFRSFLQIFLYKFPFFSFFLSSQSNSEDFSLEDERLGSSSLGVKKAGEFLFIDLIFYEIDRPLTVQEYVELGMSGSTFLSFALKKVLMLLTRTVDRICHLILDTFVAF